MGLKEDVEDARGRQERKPDGGEPPRLARVMGPVERDAKEQDGIAAQAAIQDALRSGWVIQWKGHVIEDSISLYHEAMFEWLEVEAPNETDQSGH